MFTLNKKLLISISAATALSLGLTACMESSAAPTQSVAPVKASIDGGLSYPVVDGKTGPYYVNTQFNGVKINNGRVPTHAEYEE
jgi:hypothetical protein